MSGRYELAERLGGGGDGIVFAARDLLLGRRVAVKVRREDTGCDHPGRFEQEARLLAGLSHAGLVTVYDAGTDTELTSQPLSYLVMELVGATTLADRIASGPMTERHSAEVGGQLAGALAYIHSRGIVHRDVKPANVLMTDPDVDGRETAKLTDFGIARSVDEQRQTAVGMTVGTANYLSPEQATGEDVAAPSDVYALGLVLIECLTGTVAFPGHGVAAAAARLHHAPAIPTWVSGEWAALITAMTDPDPARRPPAERVAAELARMHRSATPAATRVLPALPVVAGALPAVAGPDEPSTSRRRQRRVFAVAGAAIMLVGLSIALARVPAASISGTPQAPPATRASPSAVVARSPAISTSTSTPSRPAVPGAGQNGQPGKHHHGGNGGGDNGGNGG